MFELRSGLRAYLLEGHTASDALARLNKLVLWLMPNVLATGMVVIVAKDRQSIEVAAAGHPPPLSLCGDVAKFLSVENSLPLGVSTDAAYASTALPITAGCTMLLYSDGLVESAAMPIDVGMERLRVEAMQYRGDDLHVLIEHLLAQSMNGDSAAKGFDDKTILAMRTDP